MLILLLWPCGNIINWTHCSLCFVMWLLLLSLHVFHYPHWMFIFCVRILKLGIWDLFMFMCFLTVVGSLLKSWQSFLTCASISSFVKTSAIMFPSLNVWLTCSWIICTLHLISSICSINSQGTCHYLLIIFFKDRKFVSVITLLDTLSRQNFKASWIALGLCFYIYGYP